VNVRRRAGAKRAGSAGRRCSRSPVIAPGGFPALRQRFHLDGL